jgi:hypothetical protein
MASEPRSIPINQLSLQDLSGIQQQVEKVRVRARVCIIFTKKHSCFSCLQEVQFFAESLQELRVVQRKFRNSLDTVDMMKATEDGATALVPLTESVCLFFLKLFL